MLEFANAFSVHEKRWHLDENTQCWLRTYKDQSFPRLTAYLQRSNITCFCRTQLKPPPFSVSRHHRKKPNVCLLSPVFTSSLPPLSQSSAPDFAEPTRTNLHAAVQRQPQRLQHYQLPRLLSWSVLPAADRTDQRDGKPWGQRPLAVCCQGLGVLHSGSEGKHVISLKTFVFRYVKKMLFLMFFSMRVLNCFRNCNKGSFLGLYLMRSWSFRRGTDFDLKFKI